MTSLRFLARLLAASHTDEVGVSLKSLELPRCLRRQEGEACGRRRCEEKTRSTGALDRHSWHSSTQ